MKRYFLIPFVMLMFVMALFPLYLYFEQNVFDDRTTKLVLFWMDITMIVLSPIMLILFLIWLLKRNKSVKLIDSLNDLPNNFFILMWFFIGLFIIGAIIDPEPEPPVENLVDKLVIASTVIFVLFMFLIMSVPLVKRYRKKINQDKRD